MQKKVKNIISKKPAKKRCKKAGGVYLGTATWGYRTTNKWKLTWEFATTTGISWLTDAFKGYCKPLRIQIFAHSCATFGTRICTCAASIVLKPEFEKTIVFMVVFLENSENFLDFAKSSKKFGKFSNFLEFSEIIENSLVFSYAFLNFLDFSRML